MLRLQINATPEQNFNDAKLLMKHCEYDPNHQNYQAALKILNDLSYQNDYTPAVLFLAQILYDCSQGNEDENKAEAMQLYEKAAKKDPQAQFEYGIILLKRGEKSKGIFNIKDAADKGNANAQYHLGDKNEREKVYDKALEWYEKAADQGHKEAIEKFIDLHLKIDKRPSTRQAIELKIQISENPLNLKNIITLTNLYLKDENLENAIGTWQELKEYRALQLDSITDSIKQIDKAMLDFADKLYLGAVYEPSKIDSAIKIYEILAPSNPDAAANLVGIYEHGHGGVEIDFRKVQQYEEMHKPATTLERPNQPQRLNEYQISQQNLRA